jgi:hypothetical protein
MTNKKEVAQKVFEAFWKDEPHPCEVDGYEIANALRELVAELQYYQFKEDVEDMVLDARAILDVCDELENL